MIAIDPVCHMEVETETAEWVSEYKGQKYYFCAPGCKRSFDRDPDHYLHEHSGHDSEMHSGHSH